MKSKTRHAYVPNNDPIVMSAKTLQTGGMTLAVSMLLARARHTHTHTHRTMVQQVNQDIRTTEASTFDDLPCEAGNSFSVRRRLLLPLFLLFGTYAHPKCQRTGRRTLHDSGCGLRLLAGTRGCQVVPINVAPTNSAGVSLPDWRNEPAAHCTGMDTDG